MVQHPEYRSFTSPKTGLPASKFGNAYYHVRRHCIEKKSGSLLQAGDVVVPESVKANLSPAQINLLHKEFDLCV